MATVTATTYTHITKIPEVCGGKACIDHTRVRVNNVVCIVKDGGSIDQVREAYPQLTLAQIHAALAYYYDHTDEIDAELASNARMDETIERDKADYLARQQPR